MFLEKQSIHLNQLSNYIQRSFIFSNLKTRNWIQFANKKCDDDLTDVRQQTKQMDGQPFTRFVCVSIVFTCLFFFENL